MREQKQVTDYETFSLALNALVTAWNPQAS